jgi:hypothetical protein
VPELPYFAEDASLVPVGSVAGAVISHIENAMTGLFAGVGDTWAATLGVDTFERFQERRDKLNDSRLYHRGRKQPNTNANLQVPYTNMTAALAQQLSTTFADQMDDGCSNHTFQSGAGFEATANTVTLRMKPSYRYYSHEAPRSEHDLGIARVHTHNAPPISMTGTWNEAGSGSLSETGCWIWEWLVEEGDQVPSTLPGSAHNRKSAGSGYKSGSVLTGESQD